jgi:hypothetical protein
LTYINNTVLVSKYGPIRIVVVFALAIALIYYGYQLAYKTASAT